MSATRCCSRAGVILYDTNVLGTKGPRKMTVHVPPVAPDGSIRAATSTAEGPSLLDNVKSGDFGDSIRLHNKEPRWNESLGAYCLNFNGRVTLPSVKNFQLQMEAGAVAVASLTCPQGSPRF
jgi:tubby-related protein 1